jgi:glutathione synthase/RimK-type ligase-like ATP-grasp enzyme
MEGAHRAEDIGGVIIGIHLDKLWGPSVAEKWIEFLRARDVDVKIVDLLKDDFIEQVKECDGVMWRWGHVQQEKQSAKQILYTIEQYLGIPVFPNSRTSWHFDEKIPQWYLLKALGAPLPATWVFWDYDTARAWACSAPYPVVFKLSVGAGSSNVVMAANETEAVRLIDRMFKAGIFPMTMNEYTRHGLPCSRGELKSLAGRVVPAARYIVRDEYPPLAPLIPWWKPELGYALFQEFLPGNDFDTRVTVIGDRAFAYRRMNRPNDFRASGSGNFDCDPSKIDKRCVEIAFTTSRKGKVQSMAYDFLYRNGEPVICEISYTFVDWMVYECPGHWSPDLIWHEGQMWPEEAQVEDFMTEISKRDFL